MRPGTTDTVESAFSNLGQHFHYRSSSDPKPQKIKIKAFRVKEGSYNINLKPTDINHCTGFLKVKLKKKFIFN